MSATTIPKPMTFRRWYNGNLFSDSSAWATDGRVMVRLDALRTKGARTLIAKRTKEPRQYADGDVKAEHVIATASAATWVNRARHVGTYECPRFTGDPLQRDRTVEVPAMSYQVIEPIDGIGTSLFQPCAVLWLLEHVKWSALRLDPLRGSLWLVDLFDKPLALAMPISVPAEVMDSVAFRAWRARQP